MNKFLNIVGNSSNSSMSRCRRWHWRVLRFPTLSKRKARFSCSRVERIVISRRRIMTSSAVHSESRKTSFYGASVSFTSYLERVNRANSPHPPPPFHSPFRLTCRTCAAGANNTVVYALPNSAIARQSLRDNSRRFIVPDHMTAKIRPRGADRISVSLSAAIITALLSSAPVIGRKVELTLEEKASILLPTRVHTVGRSLLLHVLIMHSSFTILFFIPLWHTTALFEM